MTISTFFTTPGLGGIFAITVLLSAAVTYFSLTRWILRGGQEEGQPWERMGWPFE